MHVSLTWLEYPGEGHQGGVPRRVICLGEEVVNTGGNVSVL